MPTIFAITWDSTAGRFVVKTGGYDSSLIAFRAIVSGKLADDSIHLGAIPAGLFTADATGRGKFGDTFMVSSLIAAGAIGGGLIRNLDILSGKYAQESIRTNDLGLGQVISSIVGANILATPHIRNQGILSASIGLGAIGDGHLVDIAATKLTGFLPFARLSGLPFANLNTEIQSFTNLLTNGSFEIGDPPSGWTHNASDSREQPPLAEGHPQVAKVGTYIAKVQSNGAYQRMEQSISNFARYRGRKVTLGAWVYGRSTNDKGNLMDIRDSASTSPGGAIPKDDTWHWLTVTLSVDLNTTYLTVCFWANSGATADIDDIIYVDGAILVEGDSCPAFSPIPGDYSSILSGAIGSGQIGGMLLADLGLLSGKIASGAIWSRDIGNLAIVSGKLADASINLAAIPDSMITEAKLVSGISIDVSEYMVEPGYTATEDIAPYSPVFLKRTPDAFIGGKVEAATAFSGKMPAIGVVAFNVLSGIGLPAVKSGYPTSIYTIGRGLAPSTLVSGKRGQIVYVASGSVGSGYITLTPLSYSGAIVQQIGIVADNTGMFIIPSPIMVDIA